MKAKRQAKIIDLISRYDITTQEELLKKLQEEGFAVTQATISRDIKELRLVKSLSREGVYRYTTPQRPGSAGGVNFNYSIIIAEALRQVDYAQNIVCAFCYKGLASSACAAFDEMQWNGFVGSLAGDDTFLILMKSEEYARELCEELRTYIPQNR